MDWIYGWIGTEITYWEAKQSVQYREPGWDEIFLVLFLFLIPGILALVGG
jgi:hypothetical protein